MAVTPNYSWPVPVNTDLVKDGADAIKDLGDAIDATVFGLGSSALALVKTQVVDTAVTSVTVTGAFSATYDSYKIVYSNGTASVVGYLQIQLRTGVATSTTGYFSGFSGAAYAGASVGSAGTNNGSSWEYAAYGNGADFATVNMELINPFLARKTVMTNFGALANQPMLGGGYHNVATSYDQFVLTPDSGTLTGGTIRVYGYQN